MPLVVVTPSIFLLLLRAVSLDRGYTLHCSTWIIDKFVHSPSWGFNPFPIEFGFSFRDRSVQSSSALTETSESSFDQVCKWDHTSHWPFCLSPSIPYRDVTNLSDSKLENASRVHEVVKISCFMRGVGALRLRSVKRILEA
ncbi:hypothetical protein ACFE04_022429 [Oxalis oulophora]